MADTVEKNPLIYLYRSLEKADSRRLGKWLDSPIHNQRDDVRALHAYLVGADGRLQKTNALSKTRIWKRLFPQEDFDDARLRQTFHWALKATESFLAYERWREAPINEQLALISSLRTYQDPSHIERALKKADQLQEQDRLKNETFYRNQYQLELERDEYRSYHKLLDKPNFQQIADNLDLAYLIEKLKVSCNILYQRRMYRQEFSLNFLPEVISRVEAYDLKAYPTLAIYYYVYRGLTEEDVRGTHTTLLRDTLAEHEQLLSKPDLRYVILMAINLCITHMNQGHEAYAREAFEWYKLGLHQDVIAENGLLTRTTYLNIVSNAIKLREYAWTEDFIQRYTHQLEDDIRENTERFARARLGYEQKDYDTVMPLLVQVDFKHPVYNLLAKTLLLKIYYELEEFDALESQVDSMITYIRRKKLSDLHRDNFTNVARLVRQLSRIPPRDQGKLQELIQKIEQTTPLNDKQWLLEQARSLQS
ncbi:hypothetical protein QWY85_17710 [Neolewinella lacunae]|uniref:Uncharacterized protein n=1 Tax=Neolewinella lacunae TaxID=1517758 RepID=A0A923T9R0_9BACT|nr:hypothetical protein [Neolewinella lacunae]MBC6995799.1 hypothetical protein [Neolewinella lacunae]MDN3636508.1 hypothetical protein [Neolewinella lacunae]